MGGGGGNPFSDFSFTLLKQGKFLQTKNSFKKRFINSTAVIWKVKRKLFFSCYCNWPF